MRSGIQFKEDGNIVFFLRPFVWSVMQLVGFFWDRKIAQLLTGPGIQQPLLRMQSATKGSWPGSLARSLPCYSIVLTLLQTRTLKSQC